MPLATYSDLTAALANWLNRNDLTDRIPEFIALAEARIRRNQQWFVQIYSLQNAGSGLTCMSNPTVLPATVREVQSLWAASDAYKHPLTQMTTVEWRENAASNLDAAGPATRYLVVPNMDAWLTSQGPQLYLWPAPDSSGFVVDFQYLADLLPIGAGYVPGLFSRHPDLWLYGALVESAPFLMHDERIPTWETRFQQAVREVNLERERAQHAGTPAPARLAMWS